MRRLIAFACEGSLLAGTLDEAPGGTGVLIVSGGNEVRCGAHRGMAMLAQALAAEGIPVFRFDRRGVGDSDGENRGYASSTPDIAAALAAFRREQPQVRRVIGFGNCDAASALLLHDHDCDALVLTNPWLGDDAAAAPAAAVRRYYLRRLASPHAWRHLLSGGVRTIAGALGHAFGLSPEQPLAGRVTAALTRRPLTIALATGDRTAQVFAAGIRTPAQVRIVTIDTASHSFAGRGDALLRLLLDAAADGRDKSVR